MFNTIMEQNADLNASTFVELQSIKTEFFDTQLVDVLVRPMSDRPFQHEPVATGHVADLHIDEGAICTTNTVSSNFDVHAASSPSKRVKKNKIDMKHGKVKKISKTSFNKKIRSKLKNGRKRANAMKSSSSLSLSAAGTKKPKCEYPRLCSGCGHAYKTKQSFWNHKQRCSMLPENMRSNKVDENGVPVEGAANGELVRRKEYICAHCERHYRKKYNLREHLKNTCRGKPCSKGRLQCWQPGCMQTFYKYVDLVQHVTLQHGQDLHIQKLQFPNFSAFNSWKTEESNSKFMYARKITGSKRFSNTKYHYFVCQFNHRNEKKNNNRKTNRRKKDSLVVPNYNCPSRIMVKECENQILVTYISSHNHELNLSNVKYQPLEKETRAYIKTLLQLGVSPKKIIDHLRAGVGNPEIDGFLTTKQHFLTLNRIKRMESKLRAKNRARQSELEAESRATVANACDSDSFVPDDPFPSCEIVMDGSSDGAAVAVGRSSTSSFSPSVAVVESAPPSKSGARPKGSDEVVRSIESNLKRLKSYMHKNSIKEKLSSRISKMIQDLCDECENMENSSPPAACSAVVKKPRVQSANRKRKSTAVARTAMAANASVIPIASTDVGTPPTETVSMAVPAVAVAATITASLPMQSHPVQMIHPIMIPHQPPVQMHQIHNQATSQPVNSMGQEQIMNTVVNNMVSNEAVVHHEKTFTPSINEATDLLKPIFQPFNVNMLFLKSLDRYVSEGEQLLLKQVDSCFGVGCLYDAVVNSFLNLICRSLANVLAADTGITDFVQMHQKVPDVWHCFNWADIDTIFIPCNPSKKQWILMVVLVKQQEVQILDPTGSYEDAILNVYKKHETTIQCWYEVLRNFLGMAQWNVTSPQHTKHPDPANSGVLICWYVMQYINKGSLMDNVDPDYVFRQFVFNTIVNNSSPT